MSRSLSRFRLASPPSFAQVNGTTPNLGGIAAPNSSPPNIGVTTCRQTGVLSCAKGCSKEGTASGEGGHAALAR